MRVTRYICGIVAVIMLIASLTFACVGCTRQERKDERPLIVCSVFAQYDLLGHIVGDRCDVILLQKNGNDMHSFDPTPADILNVAYADMLVVVDRDAESWVDDVIEAADNSALELIEIKNYCLLLHEESQNTIRDEHSHGHNHEHDDHECEYDEHVWMSLENAIDILSSLCDLVCERYPENAEYFRENMKEYSDNLSELRERYIALELSGERFIVADRFPFLYLAHELELDYTAAFPGCSDSTHASFEVITYLIEEVEHSRTKCIFKTEDSNINIADQVSYATGAKVYSLQSCQSITQKMLDEGVSYYSIMEKNLEILQEAYGR